MLGSGRKIGIGDGVDVGDVAGGVGYGLFGLSIDIVNPLYHSKR